MNEIKYLTFEEIQEQATKIYQDYGVIEHRSVDITALANRLGFEVYEVQFEDKTVSGMVINKPDQKHILVEEHDNERRKRFTIAHEIAHIVLHHDKQSNREFLVDFRRPLSSYTDPNDFKKEFQANMLAAALLMPKNLTIKIWDEKKDIDDIADYFRVSKSAAARRLEDLNLLD